MVTLVKGDGPDQKGHPSPPDWGLGVGFTTPPREKIYVQKTSEVPRTELINRRRSKAANRDEWRRLMREAKARNGL
jgi:hypothetical protein